ncbi:MAG: hypothetical protein R2702_17585 [Acidimicrobiales bacterium]
MSSTSRSPRGSTTRRTPSCPSPPTRCSPGDRLAAREPGGRPRRSRSPPPSRRWQRSPQSRPAGAERARALGAPDDHHLPTVGADRTARRGWTTSPPNDLGWTIARPEDWDTDRWDGLCSTTGILIRNDPVPFTRQEVPNGCTTEWEPADLRRPGLVAVEVSHFFGSQPFTPEVPRDTRAPLSPDDLTFLDHGDDPSVPEGARLAYLPVVVGGDRHYSVRVFAADDASEQDLAIAREIVASIRWPLVGPDGSEPSEVPASGSPSSSTMLACMVDRGHAPQLGAQIGRTIDGQPAAQLGWADADRADPGFAGDLATCLEAGQRAVDRFQRELSPWPTTDGPSQSPAEAERDHVLGALARLPLAERAAPLRWFDAREGTWAIVRSPDEVAPTSGEVVLVDADGAVVRAWPLPGLPPTWIHPTRDAIYAGRVGDGGAPDGAIVRIDRETLKVEGRFLPAAFDGGKVPDLPGWEVAPARPADAPLVRVGQEAASTEGLTLVDSSIGLTAIDLAAVEELFP